ncbi:MAG TPA: hypothetical protein VNI52_01420 [Sphingobacteriaceae bacterium]|nr:hypothetical protein [Sphingobacteriaceae bacterium]
MIAVEKPSASFINLGDIVDFSMVGLTMMGQVLSLFQTDTTIAKVRCIVDKAEQYFYVEINKLKPARYPEYYNAA